LNRCIPTVFGSTVEKILDENKEEIMNAANKTVTKKDLEDGSG
jgi:hypothetical protein